MALSSAGVLSSNRFSDALYPVVQVSLLFGPGKRLGTSFTSGLAMFVFAFLILSSVFIATIGVFVRNTIDIWIQLSLYIVPILSLISGFRVYRSRPFQKLLIRKFSRKRTLTKITEEDKGESAFATLNKSYIKKQAKKNVFYPFVLEVYQWGAYVVFLYASGNYKFFGQLQEVDKMNLEMGNDVWLILYFFFWSFGMYLTGFLAYSFILVSNIFIRDVTHYLCLFGESPFLPEVVERKRAFRGVSCFTNMLKSLLGFFTMGAFDVVSMTYDKDAVVTLGNAKHNDDLESSGNFDQQYWEDQVDRSLDFPGDHSTESAVQAITPAPEVMSPTKASEMLCQLLCTIEEMTGIFQPFIVLVGFFAVANTIIHITAIINIFKDFTTTHWWTLVRTFIWLVLFFRLLLSVGRISNALTRISPHVQYLHASGQLAESERGWSSFFHLIENFRVGRKGYGFPLTMRQAASIAAFVNFSFLVILSMLKPQFNQSS